MDFTLTSTHDNSFRSQGYEPKVPTREYSSKFYAHHLKTATSSETHGTHNARDYMGPHSSPFTCRYLGVRTACRDLLFKLHQKMNNRSMIKISLWHIMMLKSRGFTNQPCYKLASFLFAHLAKLNLSWETKNFYHFFLATMCIYQA